MSVGREYLKLRDAACDLLDVTAAHGLSVAEAEAAMVLAAKCLKLSSVKDGLDVSLLRTASVQTVKGMLYSCQNRDDYGSSGYQNAAQLDKMV